MLERSSLQQTALQSQGHWCLGRNDGIACLADIDFENLLPGDLLRTRFRSKRGNQPALLVLALAPEEAPGCIC
jgi:hypothetical protein